MSGSGDGLTHLDTEGRANMVDVSGKDVTSRRAVAEGYIKRAAETLERPNDDASPTRRIQLLELAIAEHQAKGFTEKHPDIVATRHEPRGFELAGNVLGRLAEPVAADAAAFELGRGQEGDVLHQRP